MLSDRAAPANRIREAFAVHPCATLTGLRQCGKTTLDTRDAYYWATHAGAELDLLVLGGGKRYGLRVQVRGCPRDHPVDAGGARGPAIESPVDRVSGR